MDTCKSEASQNYKNEAWRADSSNSQRVESLQLLLPKVNFLVISHEPHKLHQDHRDCLKRCYIPHLMVLLLPVCDDVLRWETRFMPLLQ